MSADLILFAWSLALVAAVGAGVLLSLVDGVGRLAVRLTRERRANAGPQRTESPNRATERPDGGYRPVGRLVRGFLGAMR